MKKNTIKDEFISMSELARLCNVNVETIRFYEKKKLISRPKNLNTKSSYTIEYVEQIKFIKSSQKVGFSLVEIKELLDLKLTKKTDCSSIKKITAKKTQEVSEKIESLKKILKLLKQFENQCNGAEGTEKCSILNNIKGMSL